MPNASRQHVEESLAAMRNVLNAIQSRYQQSTILYEYLEGGPGGVQSFLKVLSDGVESRRQRFGDAHLFDAGGTLDESP